MLRTLLYVLVWVVFALADGGHQKRQQTSVDMASVLSEIQALTSAYPSLPSRTATASIPYITPGGNLLQPPATLIAAIMTAVPPTVLLQLIQPTLRASIADEFKAGNTPAWYQSLPDDVKGYVGGLQKQIAGGGVNLSAVPTEVTQTADSGNGENVATSTSKAWAAQSTGSVYLGGAAALGVLGVALLL